MMGIQSLRARPGLSLDTAIMHGKTEDLQVRLQAYSASPMLVLIFCLTLEMMSTSCPIQKPYVPYNPYFNILIHACATHLSPAQTHVLYKCTLYMHSITPNAYMANMLFICYLHTSTMLLLKPLHSSCCLMLYSAWSVLKVHEASIKFRSTII
jgi:hypothetical protein